MKTFLEFLAEEMGGGDGGGEGIANTTANVEGMRTEPVVRTRLSKLLRRTRLTKLRLDNILKQQSLR